MMAYKRGVTSSHHIIITFTTVKKLVRYLMVIDDITVLFIVNQGIRRELYAVRSEQGMATLSEHKEHHHEKI